MRAMTIMCDPSQLTSRFAIHYSLVDVRAGVNLRLDWVVGYAHVRR